MTASGTLLGLLPDHEIRRLGTLLVEPFDESRVQPASYDLTLHPVILVPKSDAGGIYPTCPIDLRVDDPMRFLEKIDLTEESAFREAPRGAKGIILPPGAVCLASTAERIQCPADIAARVEGKSSLGRIFLAVHVTAGWIDAGWRGQVTLEIVNHGPWSVALWPGMPIAQVNFTRMAAPCQRPYGSPGLDSHYQDQKGPVAAVGRREQE